MASNLLRATQSRFVTDSSGEQLPYFSFLSCYTLPMNKLHIILGVIIFILSAVFGVVLYKNKHPATEIISCPTDLMMCPDGSPVGRTGPNCEFGICKQELPSYMEPLPEEVASTTPVASTTNTSTSKSSTPRSLVQTVVDSVVEVVSKVTETLGLTDKPTVVPTTQNNQTTSQNNQTPTSEKNAVFNETRYTVINGTIVDENGTVIYTFPPSSTSTNGWTTHVVNVVPTNSVTAIINSIPIVGQPGQFYISENSLGNIEACEFSNKVYILDIKTGEKILMYEENSQTAGSAISRSCTSELYLLATEGEKLILKSHTVGTGTTCEGTWSEPEQTWYLDVTKLEKGLRRYIISATLYYKAENEEKNCRLQYEATSTPQNGIGG